LGIITGDGSAFAAGQQLVAEKAEGGDTADAADGFALVGGEGCFGGVFDDRQAVDGGNAVDHGPCRPDAEEMHRDNRVFCG
jgi:hypothetical protein